MSTRKPTRLPLSVRKAILVLGLSSKELSRQSVIDAWGERMLEPVIEAAQGSNDSEPIFEIDMAKGTLIKWFEEHPDGSA